MENLTGMQVTVFGINDFAMTKVARGTVYSVEGNRIVVELPREPRKRKVQLMGFPLDRDTLVFLGDAPFKADRESSNVSHGNACLNLVGDIAVVKEWIETKNLNANFTHRDGVMMVTPKGGFDSNFEPVYPDAPTHSAPVEGYRKAFAEKVAA